MAAEMQKIATFEGVREDIVVVNNSGRGSRNQGESLEQLRGPGLKAANIKDKLSSNAQFV